MTEYLKAACCEPSELWRRSDGQKTVKLLYKQEEKQVVDPERDKQGGEKKDEEVSVEVRRAASAHRDAGLSTSTPTPATEPLAK